MTHKVDVPDSPGSVVMNRFYDHAVFDTFRYVEYGQRHGTGDEDRCIGEVDTYKRSINLS